ENYYWPGNVRELANVVERALINSNGNVLQLADKLDSELPVAVNGNGSNGHHKPLSTLEDVERDHILAVLDACEWRIEGPNGAAEVLALNSSTLRSRMNKLGIKRPKPQFSVVSASKN
ncbi:MAG TPA: helix-turn-helix domain-containing protein, partial [Pyrinomonadaceae bacterium]|nr:helix-turn-helix domain-containing protein [Pyrinomonadaceae bacterium]